MKYGLEAYNKVLTSMEGYDSENNGVDLSVSYDKKEKSLDPECEYLLEGHEVPEEQDETKIVSFWDLIEKCAPSPEYIPKPGEWTAIDCGANVGEISQSFLQHGGKVYAFEPNKAVYNILKERMSEHPWIVCYNAAVSDKHETTKLYLHKKLDGLKQEDVKSEDDYFLHVRYSQGSSLKSDKRNVDENNYQEVQSVRLCDFIRQIQNHPDIPPILILKIDVEGAEVDLLRDLLDTGIAEEIPFIFVETHDQKIPSIADEMVKIRQRIEDGRKNNKYHNIYLNWM